MPNEELIHLPHEILIEKNILFECVTNKGFIQRLVTQFLSKFRQHANICPIIKNWEETIKQDEKLINVAYKELSKAFIEIKRALVLLEEKGTIINFQETPQKPAYQDIIDDICASGSFLSCKKPPYERVYYKLRALYVYHISKSYDLEFAPSALAAIEKDKAINHLASADCNPAYLWAELLFLESAWQVAGQKISIVWENIEPNEDAMWLESDRVFRQAFRNYLAGELWNSDNTNYRVEFFNKNRVKSMINRLLKETNLILSLHSINITDKKAKNLKTKKLESDINTLIPFAIKIWEQEVPLCHFSQLRPTELAKKLIDTLPKNVFLHIPKEKAYPRAKEALSITDPRDYHKNGGACKGLKPNWQKFYWVEYPIS